jgi:SAM-dependent methyltransferase
MSSLTGTTSETTSTTTRTSADIDWKVGDRVIANWEEDGEGYPGTIDICNDDGTYNIVYDDEGEEYGVLKKNIWGRALAKECYEENEDSIYANTISRADAEATSAIVVENSNVQMSESVQNGVAVGVDRKEGEEGEFESESFWDGFYKDLDGELYDWYSTEGWLPSAVETVGRKLTDVEGGLSVLDVGCGTCPLVLDLAKRSVVANAAAIYTDVAEKDVEEEKKVEEMEKKMVEEDNETEEDLDDVGDMFGDSDDETEEEAQAKREAIRKLAASSTASSITATDLPPIWRCLIGVDFAKEAIAIMNNNYTKDAIIEMNESLQNITNSASVTIPTIQFGVADARELCRDVLEGGAWKETELQQQQQQQQPFDLLVDKGCLDCFVTGSGDLDIEQYFQQVHSCLAPGGRWVLIPVNGSDIVKLLATGGRVIEHDSRSVGGGDASHAARAAKWAAEKRKHHDGREKEREAKPHNLVLECIRAYQSKHVHIVRRVEDAPINWLEKIEEDGKGGSSSSCSSSKGIPALPIICGDCEKSWPWPDFPKRCTCGNQVQRFALS